MEARRVAQEDLMLLLAAGADGPYDFDPIRVMKGSFIIAQQGRQEWRGLYDFRPYDYGPFDPSVYRTKDTLIARGLLVVSKESRYPSYRLTDAGHTHLVDVEHRVGAAAASWVKRIGHYVTSKSFSQLLDEVYRRFPEYAVRSVVASPS